MGFGMAKQRATQAGRPHSSSYDQGAQQCLRPIQLETDDPVRFRNRTGIVEAVEMRCRQIGYRETRAP
jgi:hypothetical protein